MSRLLMLKKVIWCVETSVQVAASFLVFALIAYISINAKSGPCAYSCVEHFTYSLFDVQILA